MYILLKFQNLPTGDRIKTLELTAGVSSATYIVSCVDAWDGAVVGFVFSLNTYLSANASVFIKKEHSSIDMTTSMEM